MKKVGFGVAFYALIAILLVFLIYNLGNTFDSKTEEDFIQSISISMLILFVTGIIWVFYYFLSTNKELDKDRISGLIKKKVYTADGEYFGEVSDILLGKNKIYGLKVLAKKGKKKSKFIVLSSYIDNYGQVILIDSKIKEKI